MTSMTHLMALSTTRSTTWKALALLIAVAVSTAAVAQSPEVDVDAGPNLDEELRVVRLDAVPPNVMAAARKAAPDVAFQQADSLWLNDRRVYRISGRLFREVWTVHVQENGRLIRVERDVQDGD